VELGREMKLRAHRQPIQSTPALDGELLKDNSKWEQLRTLKTQTALRAGS